MNSDKYIKLSQRLINKNGRRIAIDKLQTTSESDKPWKEQEPIFNPDLHLETVGCFVPASADFAEKIVSTELIARAESVVLVAPSDIDIRKHNVVTDKGVQFKIEWVQVLEPSDKPLLYVLGLSS